MTQNTVVNQSTAVKDFITLCKPRVVALMVLTAVIAMLLASPPQAIPWLLMLWATFGISLAAAAGAAVNHLADRHIDALMARTHKRPLPTGRIQPKQVVLFASLLTVASMVILVLLVNTLTAVLSLFALVGYAGVYTLYLKRATPQNIVIGGLAGAMPPLLGWSAITGEINAGALLLVIIIFTWTPPHFWALAIARHSDYAKAKIPMLPVTHGLPFTRLSVLLYTLLMVATTYLPIAISMSGLIYFIGVSLINAGFIYYAIQLYRNKNPKYAMETFRYSIYYLMVLFVLLLIDHFWLIWL